MEYKAALQRAMKYCAGTEHCTFDVRQKLREWEVAEETSDQIMQQLYKENFVDDARYARSYVAEKWNLNKWGRIKIRHQLKVKRIEDAIIALALEGLSDDEYKIGIQQILESKWKELQHKRDWSTLQKVAAFGMSRGIEEELIFEWVNERLEN